MISSPNSPTILFETSLHKHRWCFSLCHRSSLLIVIIFSSRILLISDNYGAILKTQYSYSSPLWTSDSAINANLYKTVFEDDNNDIKLPAFWNHPVNKLCLGMQKNSGVVKWISATVNGGSSLRSLLASGQERLTNITRAKWKSLISPSNLQKNCNK